MNRAFAKSGRISQVERLLLASRAHLSQAEIARRCDVHRSTIGRLIQDMIDNEIPVRVDDEGLIYIEPTAYTSTIRLKLHEAMAVFLAGRLLARYSDKPNAHAVEALDKLGTALRGVMPALGQHITSTSAALRGRLPKQAHEHQRTLEKLTEAWAAGRKVQIWYRPLNARKAFQHTFAPYLLEPSGIGYSTYAIGIAEPPNKLRTRKLERIERIVSTDEPFDVPADFDSNTLLAGAWSIWFDEDDQPTRVRLRFSGHQAIRRVHETTWHPSQHTEQDAEGRVIWTAEIDEPQEVLPWIRGWEGGTCEVLEPAELREKVMGEVRRLMRTYGISTAKRRADEPDDELFGQLFGG
jgi:predicted DNA-binding transcriptional regulator YafY